MTPVGGRRSARWRVVAGCEFEDCLAGDAAHGDEGLADGGQWGIGPGACGDVVEADDAEVLGDVQPADPGCVDGAEGLQVAGGEDGGGWFRRTANPLGAGRVVGGVADDLQETGRFGGPPYSVARATRATTRSSPNAPCRSCTTSRSGGRSRTARPPRSCVRISRSTGTRCASRPTGWPCRGRNGVSRATSCRTSSGRTAVRCRRSMPVSTSAVTRLPAYRRT